MTLDGVVVILIWAVAGLVIWAAWLTLLAHRSKDRF